MVGSKFSSTKGSNASSMRGGSRRRAEVVWSSLLAPVMAILRQDLRGISLSTHSMLTKYYVMSGWSLVLWSICCCQGDQSRTICTHAYVLQSRGVVRLLCLRMIGGGRQKTENDILLKRYKKHGNFVSVSTCWSSKFSLRWDEIVKQGPK